MLTTRLLINVFQTFSDLKIQLADVYFIVSAKQTYVGEYSDLGNPL